LDHPKAALVVLVLLLASSGVWTGVAKGSQTSSQPVTSKFFGISVIGIVDTGQTWPLNISVGTLGKTQGTEWNDLEPSNGTFVWTRLDNSIREGQSAGISNFIYTFWSTPAWASSQPAQSCILTAIENVTGCAAPPTNIGDWNAFVKALVSRYKGVVQYYELWNEANLAETYSGSVSEMVTMAKNAYEDIKTIDPTAIVLTPSVSSIGIGRDEPGCNPAECWLDEYLQAGGYAYADAVAFHEYACFSTEAACSDEGISCPTGQIESCAGTAMENVIAGIRSIADKDGLSGRPLIDTEGGLPSDIISKNLTGSDDQQTAYLARWYVIQASENVSMAVWFSEFQGEDGLAGFGTPAAQAEMNEAYKTVYSWLVGATFESPCSLSLGIWSCGIISPAGLDESITWADTNSSSTVYTSSSDVTYQDLNGTARVLEAGSDLTIDEDPMLLMSAPSISTSSSSLSTTTTATSSATTMSSTTNASSINSTTRTTATSTSQVTSSATVNTSSGFSVSTGSSSSASGNTALSLYDVMLATALQVAVLATVLIASRRPRVS
jgi:hypothetical protein